MTILNHKDSLLYPGDLVWRHSRVSWTAYRSDSTKFKAKAIKRSPHATVESFVRFLFVMSGKRVCVGFNEPEKYHQDLIAKGRILVPTSFTLQQGPYNQCHDNCCTLWRSNPELSIARGYALFSHLWNDHTWLVDQDQGIIETTLQATTYFGFVLTGQALQGFTQTVL
jgi:hypothetical protein